MKFNKNNESKNPMVLDANETIFMKRQTEHVKAKSYDVKYKNLKATTILPVDTSAPSGSTIITFRQYSKTGVAKIISDYANDFPRVDVYGIEKSAKVRGIGDSYGYSIPEIRRAQTGNFPLEQRRANTARRASDEKVDDVAWNGDAAYGLVGFIDYPGITEYTVPADGLALSKTWLSKTPDQIVRDITGLISSIITTTNGREEPDTLLLPSDQYLHIANTRMTDGDSKTILTFIMDNNPFIKIIEKVNEMGSAGAGATDRMMAFSKTLENLSLEIPQPYEQFPPIQKGMTFVINTHQETGGVIIYYPLSVAFADGI